MQATFAEANRHHSAAVMFISQADPGFDQNAPKLSPLRDPKTLVETDVPASHDGFHDFLVALRTEVIAFRKPVAYVHGDSHISGSISRSRTRPVSVSRILPGLRRSATINRMAPTTCNGSRPLWIPGAATCSPISPRSFPRIVLLCPPRTKLEKEGDH